jgi:transcriptional regulator with XRE-family HTH domain
MNAKDKKKSKKPELDIEDQLQKLGKRIKQLRIAKGYSNYESFAYENNIHRAQFGRYEKGQDLRFSTFIRLLNTFGISPKDFFSEGFDD